MLRRKTPLSTSSTLVRTSGPRRRKRMRRESGKQAKVRATRKAQRAELLEERGPLCETGCGEPWTDVHEVLPRSRGGDPTNKDGQLCLCSSCHAWAHRNPEAAMRLGLLRRAGPDEPTKVYRRPAPTVEGVSK